MREVRFRYEGKPESGYYIMITTEGSASIRHERGISMQSPTAVNHDLHVSCA